MKRKGLIAILFAAAMTAVIALSGCSMLNNEPYTPQSKSPEVSTPAIANDGVLRVGVNTGNPPLAGQSSSIMGIDVDIAAALADELGLKLEVVDVKSDAAGALKAGTVDIAMGVDASTTDKGTDLWLSDVYLQTAVALFSSNESAKVPAKGDTVKIGAQISSLSAWTITNEFGSGSLKNETDLASAFKDLSEGGVDFVAADAIVGSYAAHSAGIKAVPVGLTQTPAGYAVAIGAKNTSLQAAISTKMKSLSSNGVISLIEKKWLGSTLDLSKMPTTAGAKSNSVDANAQQATAATEEQSGASTGAIATNAVL